MLPFCCSAGNECTTSGAVCSRTETPVAEHTLLFHHIQDIGMGRFYTERRSFTQKKRGSDMKFQINELL